MSKPSKPSKPYEIGYCKTPVHTRFQPGRSGNPKGRPKGRKNPLELIDKVLATKVNMSDGRSVQRVSILEAGLRSVAAKAAKGDLKAIQLMLTLVEQARALDPQPDLGPVGADDLAIFEELLRRGQREPERDEPRTQSSSSNPGGEDD